MPGPCSIPHRNFPIKPRRTSSAPAWSLPTLSGSLKPILILGRSSNLNISSLGLCPPICTASFSLETLLLSGPPVRGRVLLLRRGPVSGFPQLGAQRASRPPRFAGLPPPACLGPPLRRAPPYRLAVGPSFFPGHTRPPPGEFPRGLLTRQPPNRSQPPPVRFFPLAFSSPSKPPPSILTPFLPPLLVLPPPHWPAPSPQGPFPQLTGPRRSATVATELLLGLLRVRPAHQPIRASRGSWRAAPQTPGKCCPRVVADKAEIAPPELRRIPGASRVL